MDPLGTPEARIRHALDALASRAEAYRRRQDYSSGRHEKPFMPPGVDAEYRAIMRMSPVPLIQTCIGLVCQRLRVEGIFADIADKSPSVAATQSWQRSKLDSRQSIVYASALTHPEGGIVSVVRAEDGTLHVMIESASQVYMHPGDDPFTTAWTVKKLPNTAAGAMSSERVQYADHRTATVTLYAKGAGGWSAERGAEIATVPGGPYFALQPFMSDRGEASSWVESLIPSQKAVDTMQGNLLLAAQFAAFRQRIVTNYDPVLRDADGEPIYQRDEDGEILLDEDGQPVPQLVNPGRTGVDRLLIFDGDANVTDLQESDLSKYEAAQTGLIHRFAAIAHIPAPYLAGEIKNVGTGASEIMESTLLGFVERIQQAAGEFWEDIFSHADPQIDARSTVVWKAAQPPQTLSAAADGITKLINLGFPLRAGLELLPGSTPAKVDRWMEWAEDEAGKVLGGNLAAALSAKRAAIEAATENVSDDDAA